MESEIYSAFWFGFVVGMIPGFLTLTVFEELGKLAARKTIEWLRED